MIELALLALLLTANGSPVVLRMLLGSRWERPVDGGRRLADGRPVFGPSKTVAGTLAAMGAAGVLSGLLGLSPWIGLLIGGLAMVGDLVSSFVKRRLGLRSGAMAPGLDQIPEALLPLLACRPLLALSWAQVASLTVAFLVAHLLISQLLYRLGVVEHPY